MQILLNGERVAVDATTLDDIQLAVQTEIPLVKQHLADQLWAIRGQGAEGVRFNRLTGEEQVLGVVHADAPHGHARHRPDRDDVAQARVTHRAPAALVHKRLLLEPEHVIRRGEGEHLHGSLAVDLRGHGAGAPVAEAGDEFGDIPGQPR